MNPSIKSGDARTDKDLVSPHRPDAPAQSKSALKKKKATGYDKYVDWKLFIIPIVLLIVILAMPTPYSMKDVGTEYKVGPKAVTGYLAKELFDQKTTLLEQWQLLTVQIMDQNMQMGALGRGPLPQAGCQVAQAEQDSGGQGQPGNGHDLGEGQRPGGPVPSPHEKRAGSSQGTGSNMKT